MAARKKLVHDDNTRLKIKTSQLINRLTSHVDGKIEMSATQVSAALGLLKKSLPDLAAQHTTQDTGKTLEDWLDELDPEAN